MIGFDWSALLLACHSSDLSALLFLCQNWGWSALLSLFSKLLVSLNGSHQLPRLSYWHCTLVELLAYLRGHELTNLHWICLIISLVELLAYLRGHELTNFSCPKHTWYMWRHRNVCCMWRHYFPNSYVVPILPVFALLSTIFYIQSIINVYGTHRL